MHLILTSLHLQSIYELREEEEDEDEVIQVVVEHHDDELEVMVE